MGRHSGELASDAGHQGSLPRPVPLNWPLKFDRIPFLDGGRDRAGCDCWGLVYLVYREILGIELPEYAISAEDLKAVAVQIGAGMGVAPFNHQVELTAARQFDILVMAGRISVDGRMRRRALHVGLMTGPTKVMHTEDGIGLLHVPLRDVKLRSMGLFRHEALL